MTIVTETPIEALIQRKAGVNGGRPCLGGTGFSVHQLSVHYNAGETPAEILDGYPHLDLARIYAGIAYCLANRERIDAEIAEAAAFYRAGAAEQKRLRVSSQ
jgi:uncharacterized protein (DUF433 family)